MPGVLFPTDGLTPIMLPDWLMSLITLDIVCKSCGSTFTLPEMEYDPDGFVCPECHTLQPYQPTDTPCGSAPSGPGVEGAEPPQRPQPLSLELDTPAEFRGPPPPPTTDPIQQDLPWR